MRCRECGADLADDVRACPACDGDAGEALPVVDLEDAELGIRTEDRYAYIPPGPQWIRRRVHDNSTRIPIAVLVGLALFFVLGAWLQRPGRDRAAAPREVRVQSLPALQRSTGTSLLVLAPDGARTFDVDRKRVRNGAVAELPAGPATAAMTSGDDAVVVVDHRAYVVPRSLEGAATSIGPAVEVFSSRQDGRVWLLTYPADGTVVAREVDLTGVETAAPAVLGGSATVRGAAGGKLVIDRLSADGTRSLATWNPSMPAEPTDTFRTGALFVASGRGVVASRPSGCVGQQCDLYLDDTSSGRHQVIENALGGGGVAAAAFTEDGRHLGVVESDGARSQGTIVDVTTGSVTRFVAGPVASTRPALAWSHDGAWLFVTTSTGAIDAVDRQGHAYALSTPRFEGAALLTR
jgi:hypothetical protein